METDRLETESYHVTHLISFQNGSSLRISPHRRTENLVEPVGLAGSLIVPPGRYGWWYFPITYTFNPGAQIQWQFAVQV